ncbi:MAG: manganese efflux pump [Firmicutes bacterium]|nr:manganese efflux pump [Bacillota bacterium]
MSLWEIFVIAVSLAMDALAVATTNGLVLKKVSFKHACIFGLYFGGFQFAMPLIGYFCGSIFSEYIAMIDHWIAFGLLSIIGGKMLWDSLQADEDEALLYDESKILAPKNMTMLAVATSIDALAVGVSFALTKGCNIWLSSAIIGIVAFALSFLGVIAGRKIGSKFQAYATRVGGCVLMIIGLRILITDLFF